MLYNWRLSADISTLLRPQGEWNRETVKGGLTPNSKPRENPVPTTEHSNAGTSWERIRKEGEKRGRMGSDSRTY